MNTARTLFQKLWDTHRVAAVDNEHDLIYIDRQLLYEVTSPQAFESLRLAGRSVRRPDTALTTVDHNVPTRRRNQRLEDPLAQAQIDQMEINSREFGLRYFGLDDERQGIIHVIGPEQGMTLPGSSIVAGDSHTSTHGAFAALAFGIGTSEVEHVLATQCLAAKRMRSLQIDVQGELPATSTAKDLILHIIAHMGTDGGRDCAIEFTGPAIRALSMEGRMTLCNMAIEAGARIGLVAVDDKTLDYVRGRPLAPKGQAWDKAEQYWRTLISDEGCQYDQHLQIDAAQVAPTVTWGTSPDMAAAIDQLVPDPLAAATGKQADVQRALKYMDLQAGQPLAGIAVDRVFIGSCTNARIEDLRSAAAMVKGKRVASTVRQALVVPGSGLVRRQAEQEGLDQVFTQAGFEWREPGCSMCLGMNEDRLNPGERCASTSNRNFEGRQGALGRTHLMSPAMAAAAAIAGHLVDIRHWDAV
ncbi:3-isopropylmalate dehydratase large subunit [Alcaligenes sp. MMA]|uniref:3-isopropylmalate dehydratase large subunit n=1 Tax=Alcaligenes sp. MMA TaxID=2893019 RepID=UPI001E52085D|nr:3-isopropylmalate dehydratase large subunit [Alcaligenes sp. MMA]MCC9164976.1 3-isopropylmalate dehydratase large subunit [Alcaligenes sp. MMA]